MASDSTLLIQPRRSRIDRIPAEVWASFVLAAIGAAVTSLIFVVNLAGQVRSQKDLTDQRIAAVEQQQRDDIGQLRQDVSYIRTRLDAVLDARAK